MKKIIEVEYVGIEDIQEIMDDAYALMREGHYVTMSGSNRVEKLFVRIMIMLDGWNSDGMFDYDYTFYMTDSEEDVKIMNECKNTLNNLLSEEE